MSRATSASLNFLPIKRLTEKMVVFGLTTIWRLATSPTMCFVGSTTDGIMLRPSALWMTFGLPASTTATTELVVPRSIPITLDIFSSYRVIFDLIENLIWLIIQLFNNYHFRRPNYRIIYFITFC